MRIFITLKNKTKIEVDTLYPKPGGFIQKIAFGDKVAGFYRKEPNIPTNVFINDIETISWKE